MATTGPYSMAKYGKYEYVYRQWYRQGKPPYVQPLAFKSLHRWYANYWPGTDSGNASNYSYDIFSSSPCYQDAYNRAYAQFKERVGEAASLAVNVAERKQAMDAMTKRASQLYRFARALKSFRFGEAASALGLQVITQTRTTVRIKRTELSKKSSWDRARAKLESESRALHRPDGFASAKFKGRYPRYRKEDDSWELRFKRRASAFGDNYLEFHFGWEPLMKDIEASWNLFTDPLRDKSGLRVVGRGTGFAAVKSPTNFPVGSSQTSFTWNSSVSIQARVRIANLDLYRLEQLGLLNPAVLAWELVPFSFIADWFANVGDYLASFTDFIGLELLYPMSTHFLRHKAEDYINVNNAYLSGIYKTGMYTSVSVERTVGISGPTLALKPQKWPSVTRGLTAISLLAGFLSTASKAR